jgi:nanoRNase/pAp phosphatase (c-di-AMP/oligoRNAs hydrolase)
MSTAPSSESSPRESVTPLKKDPVEEFVDLIDANHSFLVVAHASPDGDAIGSTLAMGRVLEQLGLTRRRGAVSLPASVTRHRSREALAQ